MNPIRIDKLQSYALALADGLFLLQSKVAILQPMLVDDQLQQRFTTPIAATGFELLRITLFLDCIKDIVALTLDTAPQSASLSTILCQLADDALLGALVERLSNADPINFTHPPEPAIRAAREANFRAREAQRRRAEFLEHFPTLRLAAVEALSSETAARLRKVRNRVISHAAMKQGSSGPRRYQLSTDIDLKWGDFESFYGLIAPIALKLVNLITTNGFDEEGYKQMDDAVAKAFWGL